MIYSLETLTRLLECCAKANLVMGTHVVVGLADHSVFFSRDFYSIPFLINYIPLEYGNYTETEIGK